MKLSAYLRKEKVTIPAFAKLIQVKRWSVDRYLAGRVPQTPAVFAIHKATKGAVTPNDLFGLK